MEPFTAHTWSAPQWGVPISYQCDSKRFEKASGALKVEIPLTFVLNQSWHKFQFAMPCDKNLDSWTTNLFAHTDVCARHIGLLKIHSPAPVATTSSAGAAGCVITVRTGPGKKAMIRILSRSWRPWFWLAVKELLRCHPIKAKLVILIAKVFFVVKGVLSAGIPEVGSNDWVRWKDAHTQNFNVMSFKFTISYASFTWRFFLGHCIL